MGGYQSEIEKEKKNREKKMRNHGFCGGFGRETVFPIPARRMGVGERGGEGVGGALQKAGGVEKGLGRCEGGRCGVWGVGGVY